MEQQTLVLMSPSLTDMITKIHKRATGGTRAAVCVIGTYVIVRQFSLTREIRPAAFQALCADSSY